MISISYLGTLKFIAKLIIPGRLVNLEMLSYNLPSRINKMVDFGSAVPIKPVNHFDKIIPFGENNIILQRNRRRYGGNSMNNVLRKNRFCSSDIFNSERKIVNPFH